MDIAYDFVSILVSVDSVLEVGNFPIQQVPVIVSILVSVDSVLEEKKRGGVKSPSYCFNPSFCGFGIGGSGGTEAEQDTA